MTVQNALDGLSVDLAGGAAMDFAWIEPGSFAMGTLPGEEGFKSQGRHEVTITEGFWLGRHEITQGQNDSQSPKGHNCLLQSQVFAADGSPTNQKGKRGNMPTSSVPEVVALPGGQFVVIH